MTTLMACEWWSVVTTQDSKNAMCHRDKFIVVDADVDCTTSTPENLEYASMTTNRYSLVGEWITEINVKGIPWC